MPLALAKLIGSGVVKCLMQRNVRLKAQVENAIIYNQWDGLRDSYWLRYQGINYFLNIMYYL